MVWRVLLTIGLITVTGMAVAVAAKNMGAPQLVISGGEKGDVDLPHALHQKSLEDCNACHNLFPQEAGAIDRLKAGDELKKMQVMRQCQNCHRDLLRAGKKAGPVRCNDCHRR